MIIIINHQWFLKLQAKWNKKHLNIKLSLIIRKYSIFASESKSRSLKTLSLVITQPLLRSSGRWFSTLEASRKCARTEESSTRNGKLGVGHYITKKRMNLWCVNHYGGDRYLSLRVEITPGEWILRLTRPNIGSAINISFATLKFLNYFYQQIHFQIVNS